MEIFGSELRTKVSESIDDVSHVFSFADEVPDDGIQYNTITVQAFNNIDKATFDIDVVIARSDIDTDSINSIVAIDFTSNDNQILALLNTSHGSIHVLI